MLKALVAIDGSDNALAAVQHVIKLVTDREPLEIHLLNVQAPLHGDVTTFVGANAVRDWHREQGEKALAKACALFDAAGIAYRKHVVVGHAAQAIAQWARQLACDKVIMGTRGLGTVPQLLLGSVSHEAIHHMDAAIPVTLVKRGHAEHRA